jgi:uncharacterized ParB-like nuclease family protein
MTQQINGLPVGTRRKVSLADLKLAPDLFQPRKRGVDTDQVAALVAVLRRGNKLPPLDVWEAADDEQFLAHGHHRLQAYLKAGKRTADARVYRCSLAEVQLVSVAENSEDRLPLSTAERTQFAWSLDCRHGGSYSANLLAQSAGISRRTVFNMRKVREQLDGAGEEMPLLWSEAKAAASTRVWQCSADEREAIFRERRSKLREKVSGPIGHEAKRDPAMVFDVLLDAMGEDAFTRAAAERGYHRGYLNEFTGGFELLAADVEVDEAASF